MGVANHVIEQLVDDMEFDTLIVWADILKVPHNENYWSGKDEANTEDALRVAVALRIGNFS